SGKHVNIGSQCLGNTNIGEVANLMIWKSKMKRTATTTSAFILALMLASCSYNSNSSITPTATPDTEQTDQVTGSIPTDSLPEDTGVLDPGTLSPDEPNGSQTDEEEAVTDNGQGDVIKAEGIYSGAADGHSVEIQIDN